MNVTKLAALAGVTATLGLGLGACSTAAPAAAPVAASTAAASTSPVPAVNYGAQYLADVAPGNAAGNAAKGSTTLTAPAAVAFGTAMVTEARALLQQSWPASVQADVHALALDAEKEAADIRSQDLAALAADDTAGGAQANVVRAELNLPAVK
jgi:hypothetical protein